MASKTISTILKLKDNFSKTIEKTSQNTKQFQKQVQQTQSSINGMKQAMTGAVKSIALKAGGIAAGLGLANFAKDSIMLASDLEEVKNVIETTFGGTAGKINKWSDSAMSAFGLGKLQAQQFNGTLGAMMKTAGFSGDTLGKMTTDISGLAGDIASFRNMDPEEAFEKLKSIVTGSSEPVEALGLDFRVASLEAYALSKGINKQWKEMTNAEQIQLRYMYTMEKTKDMQGDFAKTNKGFANQLRILQTQFKQTGANIASYVLPFLNKILIGINSFMELIPKGIAVVQDFFGRLKNVSNGSDFFVLIMESADDILFKVFPKRVADFLSGILANIVGFGTDIYDNIVRIAADLKQPFMNTFNAIKDFIGARIDEIVPLLNGLVEKTAPFMETSFNGIRDVLKGVLDGATAVFNFINDNWGLLEPIIAGVTAAVVAYKGAMVAAELWTNLVRIAQEAWTIVTDLCTIATALLNGTMALSPFGWVVIAVGAVVAIGFALWKNWDSVSSALTGIWDKIKESFANGVNWCIQKINWLIEKVNKLPGIELPTITEVGYRTSQDDAKYSASVTKSMEMYAYASGTQYSPAGLAQIHEKGGELRKLSSGETIIPADQTRQLLQGNGLGDVKVSVIIQGNVIGNEEFMEQTGDYIASKVKLALQR